MTSGNNNNNNSSGVLGAAATATAGAVVMMASWYLKQKKNKTTTTDVDVDEEIAPPPPPVSEGLCCPRGHLFEKVVGAEGTCDICHSILSIKSKKEVMVCFQCHGFVVCSKCTNDMVVATKSKHAKQPLYSKDITKSNPFSKSTHHHDNGMRLFGLGEYERAAREFETSLGMRETLARQQKLEIHHSALSAEMLARAQFLAGNVGLEKTLDTVNTAASHWEASGRYFQHKAREARSLEQELERLQQHMDTLKERVQQQQQPKTSSAPWLLDNNPKISTARKH